MVASDGEAFYTAGRVAPAGRYRRVEPPSEHTVVLERPGVLPASFDGRVALYRRLPPAPLVAGPAPRSAPGRHGVRCA